jgi:hypothetical protein
MVVVFVCAVTAVEPPRSLPVEEYPRLEVTPSNLGAGDSAVLWLVKGMHNNGCVPTYETSYTLGREPMEIYPPVYTIAVRYTGAWPGPGSVCTMALTEYGPRFTVRDLQPGTYRVKDGESIVGTFSVAIAESHSVEGTVTDDPYPTKRMPQPIGGARVYRERMECLTPPVESTRSCQYAYSVIDSTVTDKQGHYEFPKTAGGSYRLRFAATGYAARSVDCVVQSDTTIDVKLVADDAVGRVSGRVMSVECPGHLQMPCVLRAAAGCTVTVFPSNYEYPVAYSAKADSPAKASLSIIPYPAYQAITDAEGNYTIENIPLSYNSFPVTVTARKAGYVTVSTDATISNLTTTTVDFQLEPAFANAVSDRIDGVVFTVATEKSHYRVGDALRVRYSVHNRSMATVRYDFTSTCQFDMTIRGDETGEVYRYMDNRGCGDALSSIELEPGEIETFQFPTRYIDEGNSSLDITAFMIGYERSAVTVEVTLPGATEITKGGVRATSEPVVRWSKRRGELLVTVDRPRTISLDVYRLDGRRVEAVSGRQRLRTGVNGLDMTGGIRAGGVYIVRLGGEGIRETVKIGTGLHR